MNIVKDKVQKKLSIIIPHYNTPFLLEKLLLSIPDREEIEVIVVDDNSNKDLNQYQHCIDKFGKRVFFIQNKINHRSGGACRNIGLNYATGDWLLFADADDCFIDNFYSKIEKYFNLNFDIVYFIPTSVSLETEMKSNRHILSETLITDYLLDNSIPNELKIRYNIEAPWSKLIRRRIVYENKIYFDETSIANDVMFSAKVAVAADKVTGDKNIIYCISKHGGNISAATDYKAFCTRLRVFMDKYHFLHQYLTHREWKILNLNAYFLVKRAFRSNFRLGEKLRIVFLLLKSKTAIIDYNKINISRIFLKLKIK